MAAGTYTFRNAISFAAKTNHNVPVGDLQAIACTSALSRVWKPFPWNWTQSTLTAIALSDSVQDYSLAAADMTRTDSNGTGILNFYRIVNLHTVRTDVTPNKTVEIFQKKHLATELISKMSPGSYRFFSWEPDISKIRLEAAASLSGTATYQLAGVFQRTPVRLREQDLDTVMDWPDHYFEVFLLALRHKFAEQQDDPKAGTVQVVRGTKVYTGLLGQLRDAVLEMAEAEDFSDGEDLNFPSEPYGASTQGDGWGIFI